MSEEMKQSFPNPSQDEGMMPTPQEVERVQKWIRENTPMTPRDHNAWAALRSALDALKEGK